ncbi:MAG: hypothetical protein CVU39_03400 [Chloroflexi bacterium HGW-Chloroflexi-10]|nr:MAG: hypothetical protein CVU39_03400 [Chloroflexi bacterium HGW-Chloroflexi-10]
MDITVQYQETLDFLYSFIDYSLTRNLRNLPEKFNLDRMFRFMQMLGDPQKAYPIIHVAGTKGKGSTSAMIASILRENNKNVGFYTSPHLHDYAERIQVNFQPIPHQILVDLVDEMKLFIPQVEGITTFELTTALAFLYFQRTNVDIAVVEVGLGGRLDATNIVDPVVSVITNLSLDHTNVLGNTLAEIAFEKGGIIKSDCPVIIAPQKEEARKVLLEISDKRSARLIEVGKDYFYSEAEHSLDWQRFVLWPKEDMAIMRKFIEQKGETNWKPMQFQIPLLGFHQIQNAATAYAVIQVLNQEGYVISNNEIFDGFSKVSWPGRFEILGRQPFFLIDSAHNRESALRLRQTVDDYFPGRPLILVIGASEDKDIDGIFAELLPRTHLAIATKSVHPRAIAPELLEKVAFQFGVKCVSTQSLEEAFAEAFRLAENDWVILVTGSIFVAAGMRDIWFSKQISSDIS